LRNRLKITLALLSLATGIPCAADVVLANNPGSLPATAQDLSNDATLAGIVGSIDDPLGVHTFKIDILNYMDFSALTVPAGDLGIPDTELFLYNSSGFAVYGNDDVSGANTLSCLPSVTAPNLCPAASPGPGPTANGIYYLSIAYSADMPLDANGNDLFLPGASTDILQPNPSAGPVTQYDGGVFTNPDFDLTNYDIVLTGTAPEPGTWIFSLSAGLALMLFRRRLLGATVPPARKSRGRAGD
jgi:hypothetical protein